METEEVILPVINFDPYEFNNHLEIWAEEPNNQSDEDITNDMAALYFDNAVKTGPQPSIEFRTDTWPSQNHWELTDSEGNIIQQSGTLQQYTVYKKISTSNPDATSFQFMMMVATVSATIPEMTDISFSETVMRKN